VFRELTEELLDLKVVEKGFGDALYATSGTKAAEASARAPARICASASAARSERRGVT